MTHDPFDLNDHRPRRPTNRDRLLAAGVREAEQQRAKDEPCPECDAGGACPACDGDGEHEDDHDADGNCSRCNGTGVCLECDGTGRFGLDPASTLSRAWELASERPEGSGGVVTTVISVRGKNRDELLADPLFCYAGRAVRRTAWTASIWGNPFGRFTKKHFSATKEEQAAEAVQMFARWLDGDLRMHLILGDNPKLSGMTPSGAVEARLAITRGVGTLKGKTLGCWCCDFDGIGDPPKPCHAVVLARMADGLESTS